MRTAWILIAAGCGSSSPVEPEPDAAAAGVEEIALVADPGVLAVDATHVYFTHGASISRVAKIGGTSELLASNQLGPTSLDVTSGRLCWVNSGTHALDFLDGSVRCAPDVMLAGAFFPSALAIEGPTLFWTEVDGQAVRRIAMDGGAPETLDQSPTSKTSIAVTATQIAWTASSDMADVVVMDRASGTKTTISSAEYSASGVILDDDDVYWVVRHALSELGAIRIARDLGEPADLVPDERYPEQLVRGDDTLYWTSDDRIRAVPMTGGAPVTVVEGRGKLGALATDGTHLYWTEPDRGAIVRMPR